MPKPVITYGGMAGRLVLIFVAWSCNVWVFHEAEQIFGVHSLEKKGCRRQRVREVPPCRQRVRKVPPCQHLPWKSKPWVVVCWHLKWYQATQSKNWRQCFWTKRKIAMKTANISISKYNSWQTTLCYQMMIRHWSLWDFMVNRMSWWFIQEWLADRQATPTRSCLWQWGRGEVLGGVSVELVCEGRGLWCSQVGCYYRSGGGTALVDFIYDRAAALGRQFVATARPRVPFFRMNLSRFGDNFFFNESVGLFGLKYWKLIFLVYGAWFCSIQI